MNLSRGEPQSPTVLWLSKMQALLVFKARHCGCSFYQCRSPMMQRLTWDLHPRFFRMKPQLWHPFVGSHTADVGSDISAPLAVSMWPFLCVLNCRKSVLLVFWSFSEIVVANEVVNCISGVFTGGVSSGSFYSVILI